MVGRTYLKPYRLVRLTENQSDRYQNAVSRILTIALGIPHKGNKAVEWLYRCCNHRWLSRDLPGGYLQARLIRFRDRATPISIHAPVQPHKNLPAAQTS